ncbi:MAG TPA: MaoC family dehydratase N-terminal domain-containing protein [Gammaproteobacteria bacterium]
MSIDIEHLRSWIGREEEATGHASGWQAAVMQATLDRVPPAYADGDPLPPGWHVFYFPEVVRLAETGPDGHRRRGEFLPPVPLPRRMWAGSRMRFLQPLRVGERLTRLSRITAVEMKEGRSGPLVFVTTEHTISGENGVATRDEHVAVYRGPGVAAGARKGNDAPAEPAWQRQVVPSPVLLFRFSALTMNSHRIHYDRDYCTGVEGYPGLVVHGPLVALLLLDLFTEANPGATPSSFDFRALAPLFDGAPFTLAGRPHGDGATLWAAGADGQVAFGATVECTPD